MKAEIISVGDEVLRGDVVNTNTSFLAARLSELGFTVHHHCAVSDNENELLSAIKSALSRSHLTVFTGGLGPTDDDLTKETVAKAIGRKLVLDEETAENMRAWFASRGAVMTDNNLKQAMAVEGGEVLKNENGTAPGIYVRQGNQAVVLLPGPPRELEPLFYEQVRPRLEKFTDSHNHYITLRIFGVGESSLEETIKDLLYNGNPTAACYAKTGEVEVRITARGASESEAGDLAAALADKIKKRVGSFVYSDCGDSLAETVVKKLKSAGKRIALAESCTGGLMAAELTAVPGASGVFEYGLSSYADWVKKRDLDVDRVIIGRHTAVSSAVAAEMAKGALNEGRADIGVGITGFAGPSADGREESDVGLVYIAVAEQNSVTVKEFRFGGRRGRAYVRNLAVKNAFDMVRRLLMKTSVEDAYTFTPREVADIAKKKDAPPAAVRIKQLLLSLVSVFSLVTALYLTFGYSEKPGAALSFSRHIKTDMPAAAQNAVKTGTLLELAALNPDTAGFVRIPGTDYGGVVVQSENEDYYRTRNFDGTSDPAGCLYASAGVDFSSKNPSNIIIHGSGLTDEQFGFLQRYTDVGFLKNHPVLTFESLSFFAREYKIVSIYYSDSGEESAEALSFGTYEDFSDFAVNAKMRSIYNMPSDILFGDRFITLTAESAEWEGARFTVLAREVRSYEDLDTRLDGIVRNPGVVYPDAWYAVNGSSPDVDADAEYAAWLEWLESNDKNAPSENPNGGTAAESSGEDEEDIGEGGTPSNAGEDGGEPAEIIGPPPETGEGTGTAGPSAEPPAQTPSGPAPAAPPAQTPPAAPTPASGQITVTSYSTGRRISGTPLEIVSMIVEAEVGSSFHPEAIKAQAVAVITHLKYSYRTSEAPVVPLLSASSTVTNCVSEVINTGMFYGGEIIYAPYCSSMAGRSNACDEVWVQSLPYLVSVESKYDSGLSGYSRTYTWTKAEMEKILEEYYEIELSETPETWIQVLGYTSGGYVGNMSIDGKYSTTGSRFRANCVFIRSAAFTHAYDPASETFTVTTSGYGHGVGMSQYGANLYAQNEGLSYQQILGHYYTGVSLGTVTW